MKPSGDKQSLSMSPALLTKIKEAAEAERRTPEDLVGEAVERYLEAQRWLKLIAYGEEQARSLGLGEADVPRLIAEYRREKPQQRS